MPKPSLTLPFLVHQVKQTHLQRFHPFGFLSSMGWCSASGSSIVNTQSEMGQEWLGWMKDTPADRPFSMKRIWNPEGWQSHLPSVSMAEDAVRDVHLRPAELILLGKLEGRDQVQATSIRTALEGNHWKNYTVNHAAKKWRSGNINRVCLKMMGKQRPSLRHLGKHTIFRHTHWFQGRSRVILNMN